MEICNAPRRIDEPGLFGMRAFVSARTDGAANSLSIEATMNFSSFLSTRILAALLGLGFSLQAHAFLYPVTTEMKTYYEKGQEELKLHLALTSMEIAGDGTRWVPSGYIMQPAQWLASQPSVIYAATPIENCTWFCIKSKGETLADFTKRWFQTNWTTRVMVPNAPGNQICSGVIIRGDQGTGVVSNLFFMSPNQGSACGYAYPFCVMEMPGAAELNHGDLFDTEANGHTASTKLWVRCNGRMLARFRFAPGGDVQGTQHVSLSNGGRSRLYVEDTPLEFMLTLNVGLNTLTLSDKLDIPADVKLGKFSGNAVLIVEQF